jgi:hypothetical protein
MEFEPLSENVEREALRIAAAFEVSKWKRIDPRISGYTMEGFDRGDNRIEFYYLEGTERPRMIRVGDGDNYSCWDEEDDEEGGVLKNLPANDEILARGLYRLGLDEDVLSQLPPLSADEKMELRLSMPREFWPQKWLDEEAAQTI